MPHLYLGYLDKRNYKELQQGVACVTPKALEDKVLKTSGSTIEPMYCKTCHLTF